MSAGGASRQDLREAGARLADLTTLLARALEQGDLDQAEALLAERGRVLEAALGAGAARAGRATATLGPVAGTLQAAGERAQAALERFAARVRQDLQGLAAGRAALAAYAPSEGLPPGFVDLRD